MNECLFRGFLHSEAYEETICIDRKTIPGKWVEGSLIKGIKGVYVAPFPYDYNDCHMIESIYLSIYAEEVIAETIGQFTGLTDKKNQRIWEHCECVVKSKLAGMWAKGYIKLVQGCFVFIEYGTRNILRLCDLALNNYEIEVVNSFYNAKMADFDAYDMNKMFLGCEKVSQI